MKKAFAIILIAFVVMMSLSAADPQTTLSTESASIRLKFTADKLVPSFKLKVAGGDAIPDRNSTTGDTYVLVDDLTDYNTKSSSVDFSISQVSDARLEGSYSFTVTASDLNLTSTAEDLGMSAEEFGAIPPENKKFLVDSYAPTVMDHDDFKDDEVTLASLSADNNSLTVNYKTVLRASDESPVDLGTFTCKWFQNRTAISGTYKATITMTIESI